jgi:3-isopropylmalate dehydrogenase
MTYTWSQIESAVTFGFKIAQTRKNKLTVVDKANVLDTSRLWRTVTKALIPKFPDVQVDFMYVDNAAMQLLTNPTYFDVIVTENLFGDILSDEASVLPGSLGLMPSASLTINSSSISASGRDRKLHLYEPIGGTAPDIAGKGVANPIAQILSAALMLRYSFNLHKEADDIERAIEAVLEEGYRTGDLVSKDTKDGGESHAIKRVGTKEIGAAIVAKL